MRPPPRPSCLPRRPPCCTQIFHHLVFPVETISKALAQIFGKATATEVSVIGVEIARWTQAIGDIVQAPKQGDYSRVAQSSLPVAAALASALFLLRLALYHWGRLLGDDDSGLRVVGDWVTAGALAVACGPVLDLRYTQVEEGNPSEYRYAHGKGDGIMRADGNAIGVYPTQHPLGA